MESGLKIGRIWGIPLHLHLSWFVIIVLVSWSLAVGVFPREYPQLSVVSYWGMGAITSLFFAISVMLHELGHSFMALRAGVGVKQITLFIFGGLAQINQDPKNPSDELRIAIAGPFTSLLLAGFFGGLWLIDRNVPLLAAPSAWLARINLILTLFNLIPGFPLDGGRVLRAIVWKITGSMLRATRVATYSGQLVAFGFIGVGVFIIFTGNFFNGLWLAFIGWFLQNAAATSYSQASIQQSLRGVKVFEVMNPDPPIVSERTNLDELVSEGVIRGGQRVFLVGDADRLRGIVTLKEITAVPRVQWESATVDQVMVPYDRVVFVDPNMELLQALQTMDTANVAQLPVMEQGVLRGLLTREQVLRYIRLCAEASG